MGTCIRDIINIYIYIYIFGWSGAPRPPAPPPMVDGPGCPPPPCRWGVESFLPSPCGVVVGFWGLGLA